MKTFYSDYSQHCMRFYLRHQTPTFKTSLDKTNWEIAKEVFEELQRNEKETIEFIYRKNFSIKENIDELIRLGHKENEIWSLINRIEKTIAIKRGLM